MKELFLEGVGGGIISFCTPHTSIDGIVKL